ncbi:hypothetical protein GEMMAAP_17920 [Gemmatimonas phototrophica]|uniref:Uncharacterized protein n=1 Tax=Gemmatimonas phototrophica TaxID=1379270 RepID=A0A143BNJ2_9BACT|nr:hypothetical protein GEMMAAP_17920 [Gemmatimonas phototrophica]
MFLLPGFPMPPFGGLVVAALVAASAPDDSESARQAALTRLRAVQVTASTRATVCGDASSGSRTWGTSCASREFNAPPLLEAPTFKWQVEYGW